MKSKKGIFFLFASLSLFSCQNTGQNKSDLHSTLKIINGIWIPIGFENKIKETKSPLQSSQTLVGISEITIDTTELKGDSLFIGAGLNNHEGDGFVIKFIKGLTDNSFKSTKIDYDNPSCFYELDYSFNSGDTFLNVNHYNQNKKLLDKFSFKKVLIKSGSLSDGLQFFVNSVLMAGNYKLPGNDKLVTFTSNGKVSGLNSFNDYYIQTDFVVKFENDIDNVTFDLNSKNKMSFAFKINRDTLDLYNTDTDSTGHVSITELKYKLVKQK